MSRIGLELSLPAAIIQESPEACWNCAERGLLCDGSLPGCLTCISSGSACAGYGVRILWPDAVAKHARCAVEARRRARLACSAPLPWHVDPLHFAAAERLLLQHWTDEIAKIALAIDYKENGYRMLVAMALENPGLLNAILAVSASHRSKWMKSSDVDSKKYLRKAMRHLQVQLQGPATAKGEQTLATMLCLASYEVFNGSKNWKTHYRAIAGWIRSQSDTSTLHPFFKTWISMMETQLAMNIGECILPEIESWLDVDQSSAIDPFIGCSVLLPRLMLKAARFSTFVKDKPPNNQFIDHEAEVLRRAEILQDEVARASTSASHPLTFAVSCATGTDSTLTPTADDAAARTAVTAAEIFRHALHIHIHRTAHGPSAPLDDRARASLDEALALLPRMHDASGPLSNLGWALVVLGAEVVDRDTRQFLRSKWRALHVLGLGNSLVSEGIAVGYWRRRDDERAGGGAPRGSWQDMVREGGGGGGLVPLV